MNVERNDILGPLFVHFLLLILVRHVALKIFRFQLDALGNFLRDIERGRHMRARRDIRSGGDLKSGSNNDDWGILRTGSRERVNFLRYGNAV